MIAEKFSKEIGVTHADFFRLLSRAMTDTPHSIDGLKVTGQLSEGTVTIVLGEQQVRRIALMAIPYANVSFTFDGVSEAERKRFMENFDLRFQRGGG